MITQEQRFEDGVGAKLMGDRLQWNHEGMWIRVDDLPTALIDELKQQSFQMACIICEDFIENNGHR